jgi:mRNA degradation ribonuclease J1/J2
MNSNVSAKENDPVADQGFYFVPLGGSEQFGVNFNLYACQGKWLAMDCGIGFADETLSECRYFASRSRLYRRPALMICWGSL